MIEIKRIGLSKSYQLIVDGSTAKEDNVYIDKLSDGTFHIIIYDSELNNKVLSQRISDLPGSIWDLEVFVEPYITQEEAILEEVNISHSESNEPFRLSFDFRFDFDEWKQPYSMKEYVEEYERVFKEKNIQDMRFVRDEEAAGNGFSLYVLATDATSTIGEEISKYIDTVRELNSHALTLLLSKFPSDSVFMYFDFPKEVQVPCEQYLLYFAQFLKDLGVEANTTLTHEAGQVLFTVTPEDKEQALDKIRAALELYLHLPSSPVSNAQQNEIAILRLNSELQNFQSRLSLARAEIQMKEAAIQLQQATIAQLTGEVVIDSLKDMTPKPKDKDKEELLGDIVSLVPLKGKGFEVNLPEIFRKLKRLFENKE